MPYATIEKAQARRKRYYISNREYIREKNKEYYLNNRERLCEKQREYGQKNKVYIHARLRERRATQITFKLKVMIRNRVNDVLKKKLRTGSATKDLGCTFNELKLYLESKFKPGMTWKNWTYRGWHIDHIKPLSSFDLKNRKEFLKAVHYTNLQPLWAYENWHKAAKYEKHPYKTQQHCLNRPAKARRNALACAVETVGGLVRLTEKLQ